MIFRQSARRMALVIAILATMMWDRISTCHAEVFGPEFFELTRTVVTPHIPWAVPLAGGPVRVLVIAPRVYQRDTVELAQRLDLDYEYVMLYGAGADKRPVFSKEGRGKGIRRQDVLEDFRMKIKQPYDCIIMGGIFSWNDFPDEFLYKLFKKVSEGTGLVLSAEKGRSPEVFAVLRRATALSGGKRFITTGIPYQGLAVWEKKPSRAALAAGIELRRLNQGRIAILSQIIPHSYSLQSTFLSPMPAEHRWNEYVERDYYLSLCAKAVLWASGREPKLRITALNLAGAQVDSVPQVDTLKSPDARIQLKTSGTSQGAVAVTWVLRDTTGREVASRKGQLDETGASVYRLSPELTGARYFVDCWLKEDGKVVNWGSCLIEVVHNQGIKEVVSDTKSLEVGKQAVVTFTLRQPAKARTSLRCEVEGPFDRVVARQEVPVSEGASEVQWVYTHRDPISRIVRITGSVLEDGANRENESIEIPVRLPLATDDFAAVTWQCFKGDHFNNQVLLKSTERLGDNMAFAGFMSGVPAWKTARMQAWNNWPIIAYVRHYGYDPGGANPKLIRRPYCLTDPGYKASERQRVHNTVKALAPYGVIYNLGDENTLGNSDICWSPSCLEFFRGYLRRTYQGLDRLNHKWGTQFKAWDQVMPLERNEARTSGQYARWADHRASMDSVWAENFRLAGGYIQELDPGARWGFESEGGGEDWYRGFDFTKCFKGVSFLGGTFQEYIPPLADPGGTWMGHRDPWRNVIQGFPISFRFCDFAGEGNGLYGLYTPDFRPYPVFEKICRETDIVMRGIAKLIFLCKRPRAEVVSVYSRPSIIASGLFLKSLRHKESWPEMPVPWRHVGYDMLDRGQLLNDGARIVVLGGCGAMSPEAAATLEEFVNNGGTVVADVFPAVLDSHCMPADHGGLLAKLFGIAEQGNIEKVTFVKQAKVTGALGLDEPLDFAEVGVDSGLQPAKAKVYGTADGTPICLVNKFGAGHAVLLNMNFASLRSSANSRSWLALASRIVARAGISGSKAISGVDSYGQPIRDGRPRANFFEDGTNQYAMVASGSELKFRFARDGHLYLARSGKYLGKGRWVTLPASDLGGQLVACLPYRVTSIKARIPKTIGQGQQCIVRLRVKTRGRVQPQRHVVNVSVYDPEGKEHRHYRQNADAPAGKTMIAIPFALNDTPGKWRIVLTDVASGIQAQHRVEIVK